MDTFTRTTIERASRPKGVTTHVMTDARTPGLQCFIGSRTKTFYYVFHYNHKPHRHKIGRFPFTTVEFARAEANRIASVLQQGNDPRRKTDMTLSEALDFTIERRTRDKKLNEKTATRYKNVLNLYCKDWMRRDVLTIKEIDIQELADKLAERKLYATANQVIAILSIIWKVRKLPHFAVERYALQPRKSKTEDWAEWHRSVKTLESQTKRNALLFLAHTGLRSDNGRALKWNSVDFKKRTMHVEKTKTTRDVTLPLSTSALAVLKEQQGLDDVHVFPADSKAGYIVELRDDTIKARVHDLRRLFTSAARRAELPDYCVAMLRADKGTTQRDNYDGEMAPHRWVNMVNVQLNRRFSRKT